MTRCLLVAAFLLASCSRFHASNEQRETNASGRPAGRLVVSNMNDNTATVLDAATGRVLATLLTGRAPHEVAVSHDGRWALVSNYGVRGAPGNTVTVLDVGRLEVARTIDLGSYTRPHGMAFLPGDSIFAVTSETNQAVVLVRFGVGQVLVAIPTKGRTTHMLAPSADGRSIATSNIADGTISILDVARPAEPRVIRVGRQPEGIAMSPDGRTVWAGSNGDSIVTIVDVDRGQVVDTLRGFGMPYRLAVTPDNRRVVITDPARGEVRVFDAATHRQVLRIPIVADSLVATAEFPGSPSPEGVTVSWDGRWAFVTLQGRNRVVTIDLGSGAIVGQGVTGTWSDGIGYSPLTQAR